MKLTVPLTGTAVKAEGEGPMSTGAATAPVQTPAETQQPTSLHQVKMPAQQAPEQEYKWEWNQFGKAKLVPVQAEQVADEAAGVDGENAIGEPAVDVPSLPGSQHATAGQAAEVNALQARVEQLTGMVEMLTRGQQPQQPTKPQAPQPPDPSQFDMYDPQQFAEFTKLNNAYLRAEVSHQVSSALEPHADAMLGAQWNMDFNKILGAHRHEPNFQAKMDAAIRLVHSNPTKYSIPEAYEIMSSVLPNTSPQTAAPSQSAKPAARTITREEAAAKAEQAKRLPASNGVSGAGQSAMPSHIKTLGQMMLWNRQHGRAN